MPAAAFVPKNTSSGPSSIASLSSTEGAGSMLLATEAVFTFASAMAGGFVSSSGCGFILALHPGDGARKIVRIEWLEIVDPFADADGINRQFEALGNRNKDAAPRGAVELGHDEARHAGDLLEDLHLVERVLPSGGVEHENDAVRRSLVEFLQHAHCLGELGH